MLPSGSQAFIISLVYLEGSISIIAGLQGFCFQESQSQQGLRNMERIIWIIITLPCSVVFTALGIYAWNRKKPMWFWSGSTVREYEITDVPAYNRANGKMWLAYSSVFWLSLILGIFNVSVAGIVLAVGCLGGIPVLVFVYGKIYARYRR